MTTATAKKITLRNFKKFVDQHFGNKKSPLLISVRSRFDGMQDCVTECSSNDKIFSVAVRRTQWENKYDGSIPREVETPRDNSNTLGIQGIWLVGGARRGDWFQLYCQDGYMGIKVSNCCGSFIVAIKIPE